MAGREAGGMAGAAGGHFAASPRFSRVGEALRRRWALDVRLNRFIRVSMQVFGYTAADAAAALAEMRSQTAGFVPGAPPPQLASWALTTQAYLVQIAQANGLRLATFDREIRDACVEVIGLRRT